MTMVINNEPWFVGKDVAMMLGYVFPRRALYNHVDEEDKTTVLIQHTGSNYKSKTIFINESGLYALILSSKFPQAKKFKRWVASEVLGYSQTAKAIREHVDEKDKGGSIITPPPIAKQSTTIMQGNIRGAWVCETRKCSRKACGCRK